MNKLTKNIIVGAIMVFTGVLMLAGATFHNVEVEHGKYGVSVYRAVNPVNNNCLTVMHSKLGFEFLRSGPIVPGNRHKCGNFLIPIHH